MSPTADQVGKVFVARVELEKRVAELGRSLSTHLLERDGGATTNALVVSPLNGGVMFATDLSRALDQQHTLEFVDVVPYARARRQGHGRIGHGFKPVLNLKGRDVIVIDDIIDTGLTLNYLVRDIEQRQPRSVTVCALFDRPVARLIEPPLTFTGFAAPGELLVGYGLEHEGRYGQLPDVHLLHLHTQRSGLAA